MAIESIRPPAVAGQFYPGDPASLQSALATLLASAHTTELPTRPKALIVPHAGYIYSGPIAASAYRALAPYREAIRRVILLGPAHRVAFQGCALPAAQSFATPIGQVAIDREHWNLLRTLDGVRVDDRPHALEHALEVQLPFLQTTLEHFTLTPLVVGQARPEAVAELLETVWGGDETLILISSDLSHYLPYADARLRDQGAIAQISGLSPTLSHSEACGATPANALLLAAARHGLQPHVLDVRNSGDTAGDRSRVVGYASVAFCLPAPALRH